MGNLCNFCKKLKENCCECNIEEIKERIQDVLKEFKEDENMETYQALDKIKEIVEF